MSDFTQELSIIYNTWLQTNFKFEFKDYNSFLCYFIVDLNNKKIVISTNKNICDIKKCDRIIKNLKHKNNSKQWNLDNIVVTENEIDKINVLQL